MPGKPIILLFFLLLIGVSSPHTTVSAQKLHFQNFTTKDGLPSVQVYNMYQDVNGYLWFATDRGICRYNGNNANMSLLWAYNNPPLTCIEVDDAAYSNTNWVGSSFDVGNQPTFSEDCNIPCNTGTTGIAEATTKDKELLTITDILGRPSQPVSNRVLFYIYDDGSVEKRAQLE